MDEIPYNDTYYPAVPTAGDACEVELTRDKNHKLEEFTRLLESTPAEKVLLREVIEVVVRCDCTLPLVAVGVEHRRICRRCWHAIDSHNKKSGQCSVFSPKG